MNHVRERVSLANKTDSLLHECAACESTGVDLSHMQIVQEMCRRLSLNQTEIQRFSYVLLERKDTEGKDLH